MKKAVNTVFEICEGKFGKRNTTVDTEIMVSRIFNDYENFAKNKISCRDDRFDKIATEKILRNVEKYL